MSEFYWSEKYGLLGQSFYNLQAIKTDIVVAWLINDHRTPGVWRAIISSSYFGNTGWDFEFARFTSEEGEVKAQVLEAVS